MAGTPAPDFTASAAETSPYIEQVSPCEGFNILCLFQVIKIALYGSGSKEQQIERAT